MLFAAIVAITLQNWNAISDVITDVIAFAASGAFALGAVLAIVAIFL